jgi:predicted neuraminidase
MRHSKFIRQIKSDDGGNHWSEAVATKLKNPDSGISMTRLSNGHLLLVYNDSQSDRTPLSICRSRDEGRSWEKPLQLESNPGEYSYPSIIQSSDGLIHVTYTFRRYAIKHVEMSESWLDHFERSD